MAHTKPEAYSETWSIQNLGYSELETYPETCQTSTMERFEEQLATIIIFTSYYYFRNINFLCHLQSWSKYFGTLQCFNTDPINHK